MISGGRFEAVSADLATVPLQRAATPPPAFSSPLPPASGFENNEEDIVPSELVEEWHRKASEDVSRRTSEVNLTSRRPSSSIGGVSNRSRVGPPPPVRPRKSSSSSFSTTASAVAAKRHQQRSLEVTRTSSSSKRGYSCCSKREKSSALAALIGCVSLASLMAGLIADLWVNTDEWIPSVNSPHDHLQDPSQPQVQPRHEQEMGSAASPSQSSTSEQRVHFAVGLWTVCPSYQDGRTGLKGKQALFFKPLIFFFFNKKVIYVHKDEVI